MIFEVWFTAKQNDDENEGYLICKSDNETQAKIDAGAALSVEFDGSCDDPEFLEVTSVFELDEDSERIKDFTDDDFTSFRKCVVYPA